MQADPEISRPIPIEPKHFQPSNFLFFGDSLSDSNGDDFRRPEYAHSTYNLLRTLNGEENTTEDGGKVQPMDVSEIIGRRGTLKSIEFTMELNAREIEREAEEKGPLGKLLAKIEANSLVALGGLLSKAVTIFESTEGKMDSLALKLLEPLAERLAREVKEHRPGSAVESILQSLHRQVNYLITVIDNDAADEIINFAEERLLNITGHLDDLIPVIPDPHYYVKGKWTAGRELDKVWVEYLVRMMSTDDQKVSLDNRAMAGSWTLCAPAKVEALKTLLDSTSGVKDSMTKLFQGSIVPPCQGLIVKSYLNQRREELRNDSGRRPELGEQIIPEDTLVVFFNSANDFLNKWQEPDDVAREMYNDVWNVLASGARKVAVVTMPDISVTPRFKGTPEGKEIKSLIEQYNTFLTMRLNNLREEFLEEDHHQLVTIDGTEMFIELMKMDGWDFDTPLLNIPIPGVDKPEEKLSREADKKGDHITAELAANAAFRDNWRLSMSADGNERIESPFQTTKGTAFYADSVHPSAEAHYEIAKFACKKLQAFNIPCDVNNYPIEQAKRESTQHHNAHTEL
ncbi:hypothetical protein EOPP23_10415 [Endozoicomonas sp. OPT23]|nr:hypothetical protein [Endozoicomonas sp. OPT23]